MSDDRPRPRVQPCVSRLVPHFHTRQVRVYAVGIDVQRGHGLRGPQVLLTPVVYFRGMARDPLRETVAVNTDNIRDLQAEQAELRKRTHALESTAQGVNLLAKPVDELQES